MKVRRHAGSSRGPTREAPSRLKKRCGKGGADAGADTLFIDALRSRGRWSVSAKSRRACRSGQHAGGGARPYARRAGGDGVQDRRTFVAAGDDGARHGARAARDPRRRVPGRARCRRSRSSSGSWASGVLRRRGQYDTTHKAHVPNIPCRERTSRRLLLYDTLFLIVSLRERTTPTTWTPIYPPRGFLRPARCALRDGFREESRRCAT